MRPYSWRCLPAGALAFAVIGVCARAGADTAGAPDVLLNVQGGIWSAKAGSDRFLDEPLFFASADAAELRVRVSPAVAEGGSNPVPLFLVPAGRGALLDPAQIRERKAERQITLAAGKRSSLRLAGGPFSPNDRIYRARLVAELVDKDGKVERAYFYPIRIDPLIPLGLKAQELEPEEMQILPWERGWAWVCIQTRHHGPADVDILIQPPSPAVEGARPLLPSQVSGKLGGGDCKSGLLVSLHDLPRGRYASLLKVNGEPLLVKLTVKHTWLVVPLLIFLGAMISLGIRELVGYLQRRAEVQNRIARIRETLDQRERLTEWDDIRARNALRRAEGTLGLLELPELDSALQEAEREPAPLPEIALIRKALAEPSLPRDVRRKVERSLRGITRTSAAADSRRVLDLLGTLAKQAADGFRKEVQDWMNLLGDDVEARKESLRAVLETNPVDDKARSLIARAVTALDRFIQDAEHLLLRRIALDPEQIALLEAIPGTLRELEERVRNGLSGPQLAAVADIAHGVLGAAWIPLIRPPDVPSGLTVKVVVLEPAQGAYLLEPVTLELTPSPPVLLEHLDLEWKVDGEPSIRGGQRLTYLFSARRTRPPEVTAYVHFPEGATPASVEARWSQQLARRSSPSRRSTSQLWIARKAATFVAVTVASVIAIALYWSDKPFGQGSDYVSMLAVGLGTDAGLIAGGGQLLGKILDFFGLKPGSGGKA